MRWLSALVVVFAASNGFAEDSDSDLAKQTQNPVANLISVPFQANTTYNAGPRERTQNVLNIQPVIPLTLNENWNLITRTIFPIVSQPSFARGQNREDGIGDTTISGFFSPKAPAFGHLVWGVGPVVTLPTASDEQLGYDQWGAGLTGVALVSAGSTVVGALMNNVFSLEGRTFSQFLLQPFLNYNFPGGWYVTSAPIITADWSREDDAWLVPVGGGFGKIVRLGNSRSTSRPRRSTTRSGRGLRAIGRHGFRCSCSFRNDGPRAGSRTHSWVHGRAPEGSRFEMGTRRYGVA